MVPGGWTLVGVATGNQTASCFANSTATPVDEGPSGGTCSCNCSINAPWTCPSGPVGVKYDVPFGMGGNPTCGSTGSPATMNNTGMCATDMYMAGGLAPGYNALDLEFNAPAATGGTCTASGTPNSGSVVYSAQDTVCTPNMGCMPNMPCMPGIPGSFSVCIEQMGDVACPAMTFTQKHLVGTGATFTCGTGCTCADSAQPTCTGTMKLYTDGSCMMGEYDYPANACTAPGGGEQGQYKSYHYVADPAPATTCTTSGSSSPTNLQLSNPQTICCAP